jgi:hypothetical protein
MTTLAAIVATAFVLGATPAPAQWLFNNPVYFSPNHGKGLSWHGDYGRGLGENGGIHSIGARAVWGLGRITVLGGVGRAWADEDVFGGRERSDVSLAGALALGVTQGPDSPVGLNMQVGLGYLHEGVRLDPISDWWDGGARVDVLFGLAVARGFAFARADGELWVAPRMQYVRVVSGQGTEGGVGLSGGLNLTVPSGFGFHVAIDWWTSGRFSPVVFGVGAHYRTVIPGVAQWRIVQGPCEVWHWAGSGTVPMADLLDRLTSALAGGWKGTSTLLTCYTQPDDATVLKVLNEPRKMHERGVRW